MTQPDETSIAYVRDLVRRSDQDRYWAALLAPDAARAHLLAIYAFNIELARIPEQAHEPRLGEIRLQWWLDALPGALRGEPADHPVLDALAVAVAAHDLPQPLLEGMIEARSFDLEREPMPDFAALDRYLVATAGAVFQLGALILGAREAREASAHAAIAYGLTGFMRSLPVHASRGQLYLPQALLAKHGLHPDAIFQGLDNDDLRAALRDVASRAADALANYRRLASDPPRQGLAAFLPLALVEPYLKALTAPGHRPLHEIAQLNPMRRYGLIWRAYLRGKV